MAEAITLSHTFGGLSSPIPLSYLDANFTQLADAIASQNTFSNYLVDTGGVNAYAVTLGAGLTGSGTAGLLIQVKISNTNTGPSTLAYNGEAAKTILNMNGDDMTAGQLISGGIYQFLTDGNNFYLTGIGLQYASFTASCTGFTVTPTGTLRVSKVGNVVTVDIPGFSGTSNSTGKTTTPAMVAAYRPASQKIFPILVNDNGGANVFGRGVIETDGTISFYKDANGGAWTTSGSASAGPATVSYIIA